MANYTIEFTQIKNRLASYGITGTDSQIEDILVDIYYRYVNNVLYRCDGVTTGINGMPWDTVAFVKPTFIEKVVTSTDAQSRPLTESWRGLHIGARFTVTHSYSENGKHSSGLVKV